METTRKNAALNWILFFLSVIAFFVVLEVKGEWVTLTLPFAGTFFAKAMDLL